MGEIEKVFLDASLLFSSCQTEVGLFQLWKLADKGLYQLLVSRYVIEKALRNLNEFNELKTLEKRLENVQVVLESDSGLPCPIELPRKMRAVLMPAISAESDYFLTGDRENFGKHMGQTIMGVRILTVRYYLEELQTRRAQIWN